MNISILTPKQTLYEKEGWSVFLPGDKGEFEILNYHAPIISLLKKGKILVDWKTPFPVKRGVIRFHSDECVVLIEE